MKILLVKPPFNPHLISTTLYEPLELEYLAAAVPEHDVEIFDMRIERNLLKKLSLFRPDIVGVSSYTCDVKTVKKIFKEIKLFDSSIKTVVGGNHATFMPHDFNEDYIDTLFIGYADHTFNEYIDACAGGTGAEGIPGLGLVHRGNIHFTEKNTASVDLDSLPFPARNLTAQYRKKYHDSLRNNLGLVMTSRGCPFRCTFCACWKLMDGKYVTRDVDSIIEELKSLAPDVDILYFSDDNTVHNVKRAWELAEKIKKHRINKKLQMYARADLIVRHPDLFRSLREAGLQYVTVGFEAVTDEGLEKINKKTTMKINSEAIRTLKKLDIYINAHFIVDPDFTDKDFDRLFRYVNDTSLYRPAYPVLTPLPGTELYKKTAADLAIKDYDFFDFAHSVLPTKLTRKRFYHRLARLYNESYSVKRFMKFKREAKRGIRTSSDFYAYNTDGISLWMLLLVRLFSIPSFLKIKYAYRSEPDG